MKTNARLLHRLLDRLLRTARAPRSPAAAAPLPAAPADFAARLAARWAEAATAGAPRPAERAAAITTAVLLPEWERLGARVAGGFALAALVVALLGWMPWSLEDADQPAALESQLHEMIYPQ